eukprot:3448641-Pleurochrysis_carterae.AAC.1
MSAATSNSATHSRCARRPCASGDTSLASARQPRATPAPLRDTARLTSVAALRLCTPPSVAARRCACISGSPPAAALASPAGSGAPRQPAPHAVQARSPGRPRPPSPEPRAAQRRQLLHSDLRLHV